MRRVQLTGDLATTRVAKPSGRRAFAPRQVAETPDTQSVARYRSSTQSLSGTAELVTEGSIAEEVKSHFPWARGALVVSVEEIVPQL